VNSGPDERSQPSGGGKVPDEFDAIVAAWRREGPVPVWPDDDLFAESPAVAAEGLDTAPTPAATAEPIPPSAPPPSAPRTHAPRAHAEDDHYIPPEPPPLPRIGPPAVVGLVLLALGLVLVLVPGWVGVGPAYGLPLGLLTLAAGLGWLVLRLWPDPPTPPRDGDDDGAVI